MAMGLMTLGRRHRISIELREHGRLSGSASSSGSGCQTEGGVRKPGGPRDTAGAIVQSSVGRLG